jgi:hypothetical protein
MTVFNGLLRSSLSFSITVAPAAASRFATVSWTAPTANTDGTALTNLAGFNVYYGTEQTDLEDVVAVTDRSVLSIVVPQLTSGVWYFQVTSVNTFGTESAPSDMVSIDTSDWGPLR